MNHLKPIEKNGMRVLSTAQVAEYFGTDTKIISYNFNYNKERYQEGTHYIVLSGDARKEFLFNNVEIHDSSKHAKFIYLWTQKGVLLHAKSLGTNKAWEAYTKLLDDYFKKVEETKQPQTDLSALSPQLQFMIQMEQKHNALEAKINMYETKQTIYESNQHKLEERVNGIDEVKESVEKIADSMTVAPDHTKVVSTVNEFARWSRLGHNEVYNKVYEQLKKIHGIDVRQRVENERERIQKEHVDKTGKFYSESTLKQKVNGIDVMVRLGCLDKFNVILVGMLAKEKTRNTLSLVR